MNPKRILVVEDDPVTCQVIQVVLEDFGFEIRIVQEAEQALQLAQDAPPDLVLLDLSLSTANPFEICESLKRDETTGSAIIVLMTHHLSEAELEQVIESQADAQVSKPFSPLGLLAIIHECLQRQSANAQTAAF